MLQIGRGKKIKVISPYLMIQFVVCMLQIGRDKNKIKVISPYIMLYFVVCMLQIGRDKI